MNGIIRWLFVSLIIIFSIGCGSDDHIFEIGSPGNDSFIINGEFGAHEDFPTIVALTKNNGTFEFCTGTLIKPDLVLTAAHCVETFDSNNIHIVYGYENINDCGINCIIPAFSASTHPDYERTDGVWNDVGLILLEEEIDQAITAKILDSNDFDSLLAIGNIIVIAGYGRNNYKPLIPLPSGNSSQASGILFYGDVPIQLRNDYEITVGEDDFDAPNGCYGDSGGPLYVNKGGEQYVSGIASRIPPGKPVECGHGIVYTLPSLFMRWVEREYLILKRYRDSYRPLPPKKPKDPPNFPEDNEEEEMVVLDRGCQYSSGHQGSLVPLWFLFIGMIFIFNRNRYSCQ